MDTGEFNVYAKEILEQKLKECRETLSELYSYQQNLGNSSIWQKVVGHWEAHEKDLENKLKRFEK